ncbi:hypothetical protein ACFSTC_28335 [Nonomuraea ferruginea]
MSMLQAAVTLLGAVGAAMVLSGPVMAVQGVRGRAEIRRELRGQGISFPHGTARRARSAGRSSPALRPARSPT